MQIPQRSLLLPGHRYTQTAYCRTSASANTSSLSSSSPTTYSTPSLPPQMLEQGPSLYHRPVLRLLYEYLHLQEPRVTKMHAMVSSIVTVVHRHLKGPLWKEAVDLLKLAVSNSAALVQPPTRGLPVVDLGLFNQTLPGPTLQFSMDLQVVYCTHDTCRLTTGNCSMQGVLGARYGFFGYYRVVGFLRGRKLSQILRFCGDPKTFSAEMYFSSN